MENCPQYILCSKSMIPVIGLSKDGGNMIHQPF